MVRFGELFRFGEQDDNNALTSLFHEYLEYLFKCRLKNREGKYWVRDGELDKDMHLDGFNNKTLRDILTKTYEEHK